MTDEARERFLADRTQALATVILTRRADLSIADTRASTGLDLHVYIEREEKPMRLAFGLLLRSATGPFTVESANRALVPTMGQFQGMRKFTYPVCLFFFTMRDDGAFFSWLAEPQVTQAGPKLVHHASARCVALTDETLNRAIDQIVEWYDAVETVLTV